MSVITHPLQSTTGRKEFLFGRVASVLGLLIVSAGLLLLAAENIPVAVALIVLGAVAYIGGAYGLKRSWEHVPAGGTRGHEPVWMFVLSWLISTIPLGASLWILAGSGLANASVAAVVAVALLSEAVTALKADREKSPLERALNIVQCLVWAAVLVRVVLAFVV